jgi:heme/copper-type cytochrome/quinol oxidase subunit 2
MLPLLHITSIIIFLLNFYFILIAVLSCNLFKPNSSENNKEQLINISEMYHLEIIYFINPVICLHYFLSEKCKFFIHGSGEVKNVEEVYMVINFYLVQKILEIDNKHQYSNKNQNVVVKFKNMEYGSKN